MLNITYNTFNSFTTPAIEFILICIGCPITNKIPSQHCQMSNNKNKIMIFDKPSESNYHYILVQCCRNVRYVEINYVKVFNKNAVYINKKASVYNSVHNVSQL